MQGELDKKYQVGFYFSAKPRRVNARQGWPSSPEENIERLKDAGLPFERGVPKCGRCGGRSSPPCSANTFLSLGQRWDTLFVGAPKSQWRTRIVSASNVSIAMPKVRYTLPDIDGRTCTDSFPEKVIGLATVKRLARTDSRVGTASNRVIRLRSATNQNLLKALSVGSATRVGHVLSTILNYII